MSRTIVGGSPFIQRDEHEKLADARGICHRGFYVFPGQMAVPLKQVKRILEAGEDGEAMVNVPITQTGAHLCEQDKCQLWDKKKGRCLDASVAIRQAYGKDAPEEHPGA